MSVVDSIIAIVVVSFCFSILTGTIVYCILDKKLKNESGWLLSRIYNNSEMLNNFYEQFQEHLYKYHR